jgi:outer membrane protein assembly factor BamE (lipoprotein component of BamABCDE complex)
MNIGMTIIAAAAAAATLSACAGIGDLASTPEYAKLEGIHAGLTRDEVRRTAGRPDVTTGTSAAGGELWIYEAKNEFGEPAEYDVDFDRDGNVRAVTSFDDR